MLLLPDAQKEKDMFNMQLREVYEQSRFTAHHFGPPITLQVLVAHTRPGLTLPKSVSETCRACRTCWPPWPLALHWPALSCSIKAPGLLLFFLMLISFTFSFVRLRLCKDSYVSKKFNPDFYPQTTLKPCPTSTCSHAVLQGVNCSVRYTSTFNL